MIDKPAIAEAFSAIYSLLRSLPYRAAKRLRRKRRRRRIAYFIVPFLLLTQSGAFAVS